MTIHFGKKNTRLLIIGFAVVVVSIFFYLRFGYQKLDRGIRSIKIVLNKPVLLEEPILYITENTQVNQDFKRTFFSYAVNDSVLLIDLNKETYIRQFRLYFQSSAENVEINGIWLQSNGDEWKLDLRELRSDEMLILEQNAQILIFEALSSQGYSYFESSRFYYTNDFPLIAVAVVVAILLSCSLILFFSKTELFHFACTMSLSDLSVFIFILTFSLFLPQEYSNISLIVSALLLIKNLNLKNFLANKINLLLIALPILILINFFIISPDFDFKVIEKYSMLFILPIYASCIRNSKLVILFVATAIIIGVGLLLGALIDISILRNLEIVSFENFTRTIHPIYYSYLVAFSILYIQLNVFVRHKYVIQFILILLLVLSGSKLVIFILLLWFVFTMSKGLRLVVVPVVILTLILFTPLKDRFGSIIKIKDLEVITEEYIQNPTDLRLNGFTLRIILWQENLKSLKNIFFGNGVSLSGSKPLVENLKKRGLTNHLEYNAHNQYISMIYKTGIIGLIILISVLTYTIKWAIQYKNFTLVNFTLLMSFAMLSESIFERVIGITFFCMVILLLSNSELIDRRESKHSVN